LPRRRFEPTSAALFVLLGIQIRLAGAFSLGENARRSLGAPSIRDENALTVSVDTDGRRQFTPRCGLNMNIKSSEDCQADSICQKHSECKRCKDSSHQQNRQTHPKNSPLAALAAVSLPAASRINGDSPAKAIVDDSAELWSMKRCDP
jgi:hypothetical protein